MRFDGQLVFSSVFSLLLSLPTLASAGDIVLSADQIKTLDIKLEAARPAVSEAVAVLPGKVIRPLNARTAVTAPYSGTVVALHVLPGERVKKGAPLATIASRDLLEAQTQLAQAEADLQIAEASARRKRLLADKNIQNPDMAAEAEAQVTKIKAVIERHKREQSLNGIVVKDGSQFVLPAETDGTIVETDVMPGDKIDAMGAVVTLDTSEEIWVEVQVPASIISGVHIGDEVALDTGGDGRIIAVGGSLDDATRSAKLYAVLPKGSDLIPGQMVTVTLKRDTVSGALSVPSNAVTRIDSRPSVFVRTGSGFSLKPIELRGRSRSEATVSGELVEGDQVAASGLPQLEQLLSSE